MEKAKIDSIYKVTFYGIPDHRSQMTILVFIGHKLHKSTAAFHSSASFFDLLCYDQPKIDDSCIFHFRIPKSTEAASHILIGVDQKCLITGDPILVSLHFADFS